MNILIIEDDTFLASRIAKVLESKIISNRIRILHSVYSFAWEIHLLDSYDIILTDLQLDNDANDRWWFEIIQMIRQKNPNIPVIVISGKWDLEDLRMAFDLWANDYIIKPFRLKELELRVCNWFRQYYFTMMKSSAQKLYKLKDLEYHIDTNEFYKDGKRIILTRMNKYLLSLFFLASGKIITDTALREKIWGDRSVIAERNVRINILRLKKSLYPYGMDDWICNVRGEWYIFSPK